MVKIKLIKDFAYSNKGYDYNLGHAGDEVEVTEDIARMAKEVGAVEVPAKKKGK